MSGNEEIGCLFMLLIIGVAGAAILDRIDKQPNIVEVKKKENIYTVYVNDERRMSAESVSVIDLYKMVGSQPIILKVRNETVRLPGRSFE